MIPCYDGEELFYYKDGGYNYNILNELANSGNENTTSNLNIDVNANNREFDVIVVIGRCDQYIQCADVVHGTLKIHRRTSGL